MPLEPWAYQWREMRVGHLVIACAVAPRPAGTAGHEYPLKQLVVNSCESSGFMAARDFQILAKETLIIFILVLDNSRIISIFRGRELATELSEIFRGEMEARKTMKLNQYSDNHEPAYKVTLALVADITTPLKKTEIVTKQQVREMFQKFILASPELWASPREEQIKEYNNQRQKARRPLVKAEILADLEISYPKKA